MLNLTYKADTNKTNDLIELEGLSFWLKITIAYPVGFSFLKSIEESQNSPV